MVMNLQDSCSNHHPTTTRGFLRTVNWNLNGAKNAEEKYDENEAKEHWHNFARNNLYGIEINDQIARVCKLNIKLSICSYYTKINLTIFKMRRLKS